MFDETPLKMVDNRAALEDLAARLSAAKVIGVDTESDSFHHYQEKVCLIQFSDPETDYIVDPLALDGDLSPLAPVFADPGIVKVFHGADYDIVCMKRDFHFEFRNIFDTMVSSQQLNVAKIGLGDLVERFYGIELEKKYQRHDWSERPLWPEHIEYARGDTHWLISLHEILTRKLAKAGRLERVLEECRLLEQREWEGRSFDPDGYLRVKTRGKVLDDTAKRVLRRLYHFRDEQARRADRPPFKVIPDEVLVEVAIAQPIDDNGLDRLFPRAKSAMKRRFGAGFLAAVEGGLADDFPIPTGKARRQAPGGPPSRLSARAAERAMEALKDWRNSLVARTADLNPMAVAANGTLKSIARMRPINLEELARVPDVRQWQVEAYGPAILDVLERIAPVAQLGSLDDEQEPTEKRKRRRRR